MVDDHIEKDCALELLQTGSVVGWLTITAMCGEHFFTGGRVQVSLQAIISHWELVSKIEIRSANSGTRKRYIVELELDRLLLILSLKLSLFLFSMLSMAPFIASAALSAPKAPQVCALMCGTAAPRPPVLLCSPSSALWSEVGLSRQ